MFTVGHSLIGDSIDVEFDALFIDNSRDHSQ